MAMGQCVYDWEAFYIPCLFHFILSCHFGYLLLIVVDMLLFGQPNQLSGGNLRGFSILLGGGIEFRRWFMGPNDRLLIEIISRSFYRGYPVVVRLSMLSTYMADNVLEMVTANYYEGIIITFV